VICFLLLGKNSEGEFNTAIGAGTFLAHTGDDNTATAQARS
jgi:hypothetical protein